MTQPRTEAGKAMPDTWLVTFLRDTVAHLQDAVDLLTAERDNAQAERDEAVRSALLALRAEVQWAQPLVWSQREADAVAAMKRMALDLIDRAMEGER